MISDQYLLLSTNLLNDSLFTINPSDYELQIKETSEPECQWINIQMHMIA